MSGGILSVCAVRNFRIIPKQILRLETNNTGIDEQGPEKISFGLAWSKDETKVALIFCGWFVDYYSFSDSESYRFKLPYLSTPSKQMLSEYRQKVIMKLGSDYMIQKLDPFFDA